MIETEITTNFNNNNVSKYSKYYNNTNSNTHIKIDRSNEYREKFIEKSRLKHGDKYNYDKVIYSNNNTKVIITCPKHGDFEQLPKGHMTKGCYKCSLEVKHKKITYNQDYYISLCKKMHGDYYDYSKVNYINSKCKIAIICPFHGLFFQKASKHIKGSNCFKCSVAFRGQMANMPENIFIKRAIEVHGEIYNYDEIKYIDYYTPITIKCKQHGEFIQKPSNHIRGHGCARCGNINRHLLKKEMNIFKE